MQPRRNADSRVLSTQRVHTLRAIGECEADYGPLCLRLEGGTALAAYYLSHRQSEDLRLFGGADFHAGDFAAFVADRLTRDGAVVEVHGQANRGLAEAFVRWPDGGSLVKVQVARMSPFHVEPAVDTDDGIRVASFRDVVAGKLHALCDRTAVRDVIDLHASLWREGIETPPDEREIVVRFLAHGDDLYAGDPGLDPVQLAHAVERGCRAARVSQFRLRLLTPITDASLQQTCMIALASLEAAIAERLRRRGE